MIEFLYTPREFYDKLIDLVSHANKRISIATLYVGDSPMERKLLETIGKGDRAVHILLDGLRGNRKDKSSSISSIEMIRKYCPTATIDPFVTPLFKGMNKLLPPRLNEIVGTQHMKLVVADETVLITGANLSEIYFTNRQDRYVVIRDSRLADKVYALIHSRGEDHKNAETIKLDDDTIEVVTQRGFESKLGQPDRVVLSLLEEVLNSGKGSEVTLSSPYLNLSPDILSILSRLPRVNIITNSIETNAFFNSKGPSRYIPEAYAIAQDDLMKRLSGNSNVSVFEYSRPGWSFHPKGVWVSTENSITNTIIGSSNFGYRSMFRDLEVSFRLSSKKERFNKQLRTELDGIMKYCKRADMGRPKRTWWLKMLTKGPLRTIL
jgi:CDP-diacylglycerol--glycerol-3-phosphate 3-phosphatidyltransferase